MWRYQIAQPLHGQNSVDRVASGNKVFRLQLLATTGRESHAEVGHPFVPGAGYTHLLSAVFGGEFGNWVQIFGREGRSEKVGGCAFRFGIRRYAFVDASFQPNLTN